MTDFDQIAKQAEADLNTYQSKTGNGRSQGLDDSGINSYAENKFEGANVEVGDELSTNRGYNKRIPPSEGGLVDDNGRQTRGDQFDGDGGPLDKISQFNQDQGGQNDNDVGGAPLNKAIGLGKHEDIAREGHEASQVNVGNNPSGPGGSQFKGENYYTPESVPDSISAEGWVAPESVTQASRETEGYSK